VLDGRLRNARADDRPRTSTSPEQAAAFIPRLIDARSDYIKFMVDDGSIDGHPASDARPGHAGRRRGLGEETRRMLTLALTIDATRMAVQAGIDCLTHVFMDQQDTGEIIALTNDARAFVVPCVVLNASIDGHQRRRAGDEPRAASRLDGDWMATLRRSLGR
jgi:hypothetical protein